MAITESRKQSDLEKRLKILRQQVNGRKEFRVESKIIANHKLQTANFSSDLTYLGYDLGKILILSTIAIGVQLMLFIFLKNHMLNLKFF